MAKEINKYLEASLEGAEVIADSLIENEVIKSIPVVGTALKVISGSLDLRDKIFISKIQRFISEIESISKEEKFKFNHKITSDSDSMASAGETALLVLDKLSDMKKAEILGFYLSCFLRGLMNQYQFRRIAVAIDLAFIDDLEEFLRIGEDELISQKKFMEALFSSGITVLSAGKKIDEAGELYYEASSMGHRMIELWKEHEKC